MILAIIIAVNMLCAPGGTRTPNVCSEDKCDIHFTTGANFGFAKFGSKSFSSCKRWKNFDQNVDRISAN